MSSYRLDLEFFEEDPLIGPIARVSLKTEATTTKGTLAVTPDCLTMRELDNGIDQLISELEAIRKKAKAKFAAHVGLHRG